MRRGLRPDEAALCARDARTHKAVRGYLETKPLYQKTLGHMHSKAKNELAG